MWLFVSLVNSIVVSNFVNSEIHLSFDLPWNLENGHIIVYWLRSLRKHSGVNLLTSDSQKNKRVRLLVWCMWTFHGHRWNYSETPFFSIWKDRRERMQSKGKRRSRNTTESWFYVPRIHVRFLQSSKPICLFILNSILRFLFDDWVSLYVKKKSKIIFNWQNHVIMHFIKEITHLAHIFSFI